MIFCRNEGKYQKKNKINIIKVTRLLLKANFKAFFKIEILHKLKVNNVLIILRHN